MNLISEVKEIADLVKKYDNIELYRKIVDLQGELVEFSTERAELLRKVEKMETQLAIAAAMHFAQPFYFKDGDAVPHCPKCWEVDGRAIHLKIPTTINQGFKYDCPNCNHEYVHSKAFGTELPRPRKQPIRAGSLY